MKKYCLCSSIKALIFSQFIFSTPIDKYAKKAQKLGLLVIIDIFVVNNGVHHQKYERELFSF